MTSVVLDLRNAATSVWPMFKGRTIRYLELDEMLRMQGYDGFVASRDAFSIIEAWKDSRWIVFSPDGSELRLTPKGHEQLAFWEEEDRLWKNGGNTSEMPLAKRLVAGEPASNLRRIQSVIGGSTVNGIHDPYTTPGSLETLLKLADMKTKFSLMLRLLRPPVTKPTERAALVGLLKDINSERKTTWVIRTYVRPTKPHRRFLVLDDGSIVTCGMSLNQIDKDEALERIVAGSEYAIHDRAFFEDEWKGGTPL